jgi:DNA-binding MarR family transcriptional regulator/predicted N-acetyltransferase YhbS
MSTAATLGVPDERIEAVRRFGRFYTRVLGVLDDHLLDTPYSLTEARILYELAQRPATEVRDLRGILGFDPGYLSRVLTRLERAGLLERSVSPQDRRRQLVSLTDHGGEAFADLDERASRQAASWLAALSDDQQVRLVAAMRTIEEALGDRPRGRVRLRAPRPGDHGWVVERHGAIYAAEYGWDERFEALVARIVADHVDQHDPRREAAWIAELDGERVGCVYCVAKDQRVAQLRILLVEPSARGLGVGSRLVRECIRFARRAGYEDLVLWTNDVLTDARRLYERAGFGLERSERHHSFGHDLVGQYWRLRLPPT